MKKLCLMLIGFSCSLVAQNAPILVTGKISSAKVQSVTAPKTESWRVQVEWMRPEGDLVKVGDLIAVFDPGNLETELEQNEERLETLQLELEQKDSDLSQQLREALGTLKIRQLQVEKAQIEAAITSGEVSDYDKGQYRMNLERALLDKTKAEQQVKIQTETKKSELEKQKIEIIKLEENIAYQKQQLDKLKVTAEVEGLVSHMLHPWNDEKITSGTTVQATMKVLQVQGLSGYQAKAWVHEVDVGRISEGDITQLSIDAFPGQQYQGKVLKVSTQPDSKAEWSESAYHQIQISFKTSPKLRLLPGMSIRAVFAAENNGIKESDNAD